MQKIEKVTSKLTRIGGSFMIPVDRPIIEMYGWKPGDILRVPYHEIEKVLDDKTGPVENELDPNGKKEVKVKIRDHDEQLIKQEDVIRILDSAEEDAKLLKYRTTYLVWNGNRIGVRNLCKKVFGHEDFHTQEGSRILEKLGFRINK